MAPDHTADVLSEKGIAVAEGIDGGWDDPAASAAALMMVGALLAPTLDSSE